MLNFLESLKDLYRAWSYWKEFTSLDASGRYLVVYSEGSHDWPHMGPMIKKFLEISKYEVRYVTSEYSDPGLNLNNHRFNTFYIGSGSVRTIFFKLLKCDVLLLTLTDLNAFHIKRSAVHDVHYVYCFHSINSTHAVYRPKAFEAYDTIFCVGPHHLDELAREAEIKFLPKRKLLAHGSVKLDSLIEEYSSLRGNPHNNIPVILLAPSWGVGSFVEKTDLLYSVFRSLFEKKFRCFLRLHPMTVRRFPGLISQLEEKFSRDIESGRFTIESDLNDNSSLRLANLMVSDWSGAAMEFAFALERPVIFINTEPKINNPNWLDYDLPRAEDLIRLEIGEVVELPDIDRIGSIVENVLAHADSKRLQLIAARNKYIFNLEDSALVGAKYLVDIMESCKK